MPRDNHPQNMAPPVTGRLKRDRMWRVLRARRCVSPEDLQCLCEVSASYAQHWLLGLKQSGFTRVSAREHFLARDPGPACPRPGKAAPCHP